MSTLFRKIHMVENAAGAVDLMLAKSSGGEFTRILLGNRKNANEVIGELQILCSQVQRGEPGAAMPHGNKQARAALNMAGGQDLIIERDGGNPVLIHTGRQWRKFWSHFEILVNEAEEEIELLARRAEFQ